MDILALTTKLRIYSFKRDNNLVTHKSEIVWSVNRLSLHSSPYVFTIFYQLVVGKMFISYEIHPLHYIFDGKMINHHTFERAVSTFLTKMFARCEKGCFKCEHLYHFNVSIHFHPTHFLAFQKRWSTRTKWSHCILTDEPFTGFLWLWHYIHFRKYVSPNYYSHTKYLTIVSHV